MEAEERHTLVLDRMGSTPVMEEQKREEGGYMMTTMSAYSLDEMSTGGAGSRGRSEEALDLESLGRVHRRRGEGWEEGKEDLGVRWDWRIGDGAARCDRPI